MLVKVPNWATARLSYLALQRGFPIQRAGDSLIDGAGCIMLRTVKPLAAHSIGSKYLMGRCFDTEWIVRTDAVNEIDGRRNITLN